MTAHELARRWLDGPDLPVGVWDAYFDCWYAEIHEVALGEVKQARDFAREAVQGVELRY